MNDSLLMGIGKTASGLQNAFSRVSDWERAFGLDQRGEIAALNELHDQEVDAAGFVGIVGRDDVWVIELGDGFDFALKTFESALGIEDLGFDDFERDDALHAAVLSLVNIAHAAA